MGSFSSLSNKLRSLKKDLKPSVTKLTTTLALDIVQELVFRTPADTSKALSNWNVKVGSSSRDVIEAYIQGERGSTRIASAEEAIGNANASLKGRKLGQIIYITNNVDYIKDLNDGSSLQAPAGFVDISVIAAKKRVRKLGFKKL